MEDESCMLNGIRLNIFFLKQDINIACMISRKAAAVPYIGASRENCNFDTNRANGDCTRSHSTKTLLANTKGSYQGPQR